MMVFCFMLSAERINAQVVIGSLDVPQEFSILELINENDKGLRLPQIETTAQRDAIFTNAPGFQSNPLAQGLQIFNMETNCVETWNGSKWISPCKTFPTDSSGNYLLSGKTCFDVKRIQLPECPVLSARTDDFANTKSYTYTFSNLASFTNLEFDVIDGDNLIVIRSINITNKTFTLTFRNDINAYATGKNKGNAYKFTIIAKFKNASGQDRQITLDAFVHDCGCSSPVS